jgi:hypothetical protein
MNICLNPNRANFRLLLTGLKRSQLVFVILIGLHPAFALASAAEQNLKVKLQFDYEKTDLRVKLYDVKSEFKFSVARTAIASSMKDIPVTQAIKDEILFSTDNKAKTFVLVVENKSDQTKYFFASPHTYHPGHVSLGMIFECLCNHHVYKVPARMIWYRIVRLETDFTKISKMASEKAKDHIVLSHSFIEVPEAKALKEYRQMLYDQSEKKE